MWSATWCCWKWPDSSMWQIILPQGTQSYLPSQRDSIVSFQNCKLSYTEGLWEIFWLLDPKLKDNDACFLHLETFDNTCSSWYYIIQVVLCCNEVTLLKYNVIKSWFRKFCHFLYISPVSEGKHSGVELSNKILKDANWPIKPRVLYSSQPPVFSSACLMAVLFDHRKPHTEDLLIDQHADPLLQAVRRLVTDTCFLILLYLAVVALKQLLSMVIWLYVKRYRVVENIEFLLHKW